MKYVKRKNGFTLIELIVVTGVLVVVGGLISGLLATTLRSTNKTKVTTAISQNGNSALSVISDLIRNSDAIVIQNGPSSYTSNGACGTPSTPVAPSSQIMLHRLDGTYTQLVCTENIIESVNATGAMVLVDKFQVIVANCSFSCQQSDPYSPPLVNIQFNVTDTNGNKSFENKLANPLTFSTQVALYNFSPQ